MHTLSSSSSDSYLSPHLLLITTAILCLCFFPPPVRSHRDPDDHLLLLRTSNFSNRNNFSSAPKTASEIASTTVVVLEVGEIAGNEFSLCSGGVDLPSSCPVKCFIADPVCGIDGVTYWCGCADAACAGTRVASRGFCPIGDVASGPVSGQALLLVHIVWLILVGVLVVLGIM